VTGRSPEPQTLENTVSEPVKYRAVFAGYRLGSKGLVCLWLKLDVSWQVTDERVMFDKKGKKNKFNDSFVGDCYDFEESDDQMIKLVGNRGRYDDPEKVSLWKAESDAAETVVRLDKQAKADTDLGPTTLADLKGRLARIYDPRHRTALLATVIEYLTR
jgi:hypothetical protein